MDERAANNLVNELETPKRSKVLLYFGVGLMGVVVIAWSVVLPVLGIVYLLQRLS